MATKMKSFPYFIKICYVPFKNKRGGKVRPILLHRLNKNIIKVWSITKEYAPKSKVIQLQYFPLFHWHPYGLNKPSYVDIKSEVSIPDDIYKQLKVCKQDPVWWLDHDDINSFINFYESYSYRFKEWERKNKLIR